VLTFFFSLRPYVVDLGSVNGTHLKNKKTGEKKKLDDARFYELKPGDVLSFGLSTREYVLLFEEMVGDVPADEEN
jgi:smad nuclear-interacting protein 1